MQRIVHLGLGNFHRAHQAWYTAHAGGWQITGVIMSNTVLRDQLAAHNNEYVLGVWGNNGLRTEALSVYDNVLLASEQPHEVVHSIADPDTHIVTLTVTEKGYYLSPADGQLDLTVEPIATDLESDTPRTSIGLLAFGIMQRAKNGGGPLTILSCDNLADNGHKLRQAIVRFLEAKRSDVLHWVNKNVSFPNSMVDRITPRLSDAAVTEIASVARMPTHSVVGTEDFSEWVISNEFVAPRPRWERAGVVLVADVASFEERKLRMLNAAHSYLAYAGLLAGYQYVHQAIADSALLAGVNALWDEAASTVSTPAADTLAEYRVALQNRFAVEAMRHELIQIASDGSVKLKERWVPILQSPDHSNSGSSQTCIAIAAWMAFVCKAMNNGDELNDPYRHWISTAYEDSVDQSEFCEKLAELIGVEPLWVPQITAALEHHEA